jgi:predicted ester cyclase
VDRRLGPAGRLGLLPSPAMGTTADVVRDVFALVNDRDLARLAAERISSDFVRHDLAEMWPGVAGRDGVRDFLTMLIGAAPDLRLEIDDLIENGDRAAVRFRMTGTHTGGPLFDVPPTGASIDVNAINIYRVENGRIAETWQLSDGLSVYRAIGIL